MEHRSEAIVRAKDASGAVAVLNRQAKMVDAKPATEIARPKPVYRSIQCTVCPPKSNGTRSMDSKTPIASGSLGRKDRNPAVCPTANNSRTTAEIRNGNL